MDFIELVTTLARMAGRHPDMALLGAVACAIPFLPRVRWVSDPLLWATRALFESDREKTKMVAGAPLLVGEVALLPLTFLMGLRLAPSKMAVALEKLERLEHAQPPLENLVARVQVLEERPMSRKQRRNETAKLSKAMLDKAKAGADAQCQS